MAERDSGWIQLYVENSQEAYDSTIQAFRIAENTGLLLPVMVCLDAFVLSHTLENVEILPDTSVHKFVGEREFAQVKSHEGSNAPFRLDPKNPITIGPLDLYDYYFEHKRQQEEAMRKASRIIQSVHNEFYELSGRRYGDGLVDEYQLKDAQIAVVCVGSTAGTVKTVVDQMRLKGIKAGLLRLRAFRPLPVRAIQKTLENVEIVGVMDRSISFGGQGGPVFHEIRHSLYELDSHPLLQNYIYGLGGRDMPPYSVEWIFKDLEKSLKRKSVETPVNFVGVRG